MPKRLHCKQKYEEDEKAAAHVFQDFIKTFQSNPHPNKVFIKSATLNAKNDMEANLEYGRIYKPIPIMPHGSVSQTNSAIECAKLIHDDLFMKSAKAGDKPKSNLDSLKEELKQRHSERILRKNIGGIAEITKPNSMCSSTSFDDNSIKQTTLDENGASGRTTNLFINNLRPTLTENDLMVLFGEYGPLASVKIMWPRSNMSTNIVDDDDRRINVNCGFVAYMSRKDSERALECMTKHSDMRISWGRAVELPSFPVYIPPRYLKLLMPPSCTGFPFNAQPNNNVKHCNYDNSDTQGLLYNSHVKVTIPFEKKQLVTIHRMVEFVVREGPLFEAMIMNRELKNPLFEFLFENKSPAHAYYRWKLYSIAHGESTNNWSKKQFRMFKGGAVWIPPNVSNFSQGMPDYLCEGNTNAITCDLSLAQETRLIQFIQNMRMTQQNIRDVTVYCLNHARAAKPIVEILCTSLLNKTTNATYKIARLYLLSDILYNVWHGKYCHDFLHAFDRYLDRIIDSLQSVYWNLRFTHDRAQFKKRVLRVLHVWESWTIFSIDRVTKWEQLFQDKTTFEDDCEQDSVEECPLDGQRLLELSKTNNEETDFDGIPIDYAEEPIDVLVSESELEHRDFVTSRWEVVDPMEIEANAMSTKRLFVLENNRLHEQKRNSHHKSSGKSANKKNVSESCSKSVKQSSECLRSKLREIEVQVLQFQDDLESGKIKPKRCRKPDEEVKNFRRKLMKKLSSESKDFYKA